MNILTTSTLASKEDGRRILSLWMDLLPDFIPDKFGNYEPIRTVFNGDNLDTVLDQWEWPFLFKKRRPKMDGEVFKAWGPRPVHGWITIRLQFRQADQESLVRFLQQIAMEFNADYGYLHLLTDDEINKNSSFRTGVFEKIIRPSLSVTTFDLKKYVPNLYWGTIFGPAYVKLFGEERLLSVPVGIAKKISEGIVYLQVTENLSDLEGNYDGFNLARQKNKDHLNNNAFFDGRNDPGHVYNTATFDFDRVRSQPQVQQIIVERDIEIKYCDQEIFEMSQLLLHDNENLGFKVSLPDERLLDYSVQSLDEINKYLDSIRVNPEVEAAWDKVILRCGAYIGEVVRRNSTSKEFHWINFETASGIAPDIFKRLGHELGTAVVLYKVGSSFYFPLAKVHKYLINGPEDNVRLFAEVTLAQRNS